MNILFYQFQEKYKPLVSRLSNVPDISIYFAFSEKELQQMHDQIDSDVIFRDKSASISHIKTHETVKPAVYVLDYHKSELQIVEELTNKRVRLEQLLCITEKGNQINKS